MYVSYDISCMFEKKVKKIKIISCVIEIIVFLMWYFLVIILGDEEFLNRYKVVIYCRFMKCVYILVLKNFLIEF